MIRSSRYMLKPELCTRCYEELAYKMGFVVCELVLMYAVWDEPVVLEHLCDLRNCRTRCWECSCQLSVAIHNDKDVLIAFPSFRKRSEDFHRDKFK